MSLLKSIACAVAVIVVGFLLTDCFMGRGKYHHCTVTNHRYVSETTSITTDADGHVSTTINPEEFHLGCLADDGPVYDISTTVWKYNSTKDGQRVWVRVQVGKFTGLGWVPIIVDTPPVAEK